MNTEENKKELATEVVENDVLANNNTKTEDEQKAIKDRLGISAPLWNEVYTAISSKTTKEEFGSTLTDLKTFILKCNLMLDQNFKNEHVKNYILLSSALSIIEVVAKELNPEIK